VMPPGAALSRGAVASPTIWYSTIRGAGSQRQDVLDPTKETSFCSAREKAPTKYESDGLRGAPPFGTARRGPGAAARTCRPARRSWSLGSRVTDHGTRCSPYYGSVRECQYEACDRQSGSTYTLDPTLMFDLCAAHRPMVFHAMSPDSYGRLEVTQRRDSDGRVRVMVGEKRP
jgi:hypothetical protein